MTIQNEKVANKLANEEPHAKKIQVGMTMDRRQSNTGYFVCWVLAFKFLKTIKLYTFSKVPANFYLVPACLADNLPNDADWP